MMYIETITRSIEESSPRSAWNKGVKAYALGLLENLREGISDGWYEDEDIRSPKILDKMLLNGASDWREYSWGGSALIYNGDIAERLCTPSELKLKKGGELRPNSREDWLDTQARALYQAASIIRRHAKALDTAE